MIMVAVVHIARRIVCVWIAVLLFSDFFRQLSIKIVHLFALGIFVAMQLLWGQVSMNARDITLIIYATRPVIIDNICKAPDIDILSSPPII